MATIEHGSGLEWIEQVAAAPVLADTTFYLDNFTVAVFLGPGQFHITGMIGRYPIA